MPFWFILIAASIGYMIDMIISSFWFILVGSLLLGIDDPTTQIILSRPDHILVMFIVPALITVFCGGIAGYIAALDPMVAGALVGGIGLFQLLGSMDSTGAITPYVIAGQCTATILAAFAARYGARRRLRKTPPQE